MTENKEGIGHTPGPWTLYEGQWGDPTSGGFHIIFGPHQPGSVHTSRLIDYCEDTFPEDGWYIEAEANARLIASAPALLEALKPFAALADARAELDEPDDMVVAAYVEGFGREAKKTSVTLGDCRSARAAIASAGGGK